MKTMKFTKNNEFEKVNELLISRRSFIHANKLHIVKKNYYKCEPNTFLVNFNCWLQTNLNPYSKWTRYYYFAISL